MSTPSFYSQAYSIWVHGKLTRTCEKTRFITGYGWPAYRQCAGRMVLDYITDRDMVH